MDWIVTSKELLALWTRFVPDEVFPESDLMDELTEMFAHLPGPHSISDLRERHRSDVDTLLRNVLGYTSPQGKLSLLEQAPRSISGLLLERTALVAFHLRQMGDVTIQLPPGPEKWRAVREHFLTILFQKRSM